MKKLIASYMVCILTLGVVGCSNLSDKEEQDNATSIATITKVVQFEDKDVISIELKDTKTNNMKEISSESTMQTVIDSLQNAKKKDVLLDKEARNNMNAVMTLKYSGGDKQDFFVWLEGNNKQVMFVESTNEQHGAGYEANGTYAKNIIKLFK
ncbi:hypothetical protein [Bacillus pseudomycoides]|uniref:hypothetical protein n=1 Tax=Bacillus pseudomycoides TaxID=64104 RepID=UPI001FB3B2B0|nr:hypothetical protein [Bacillus pseudomycoides]